MNGAALAVAVACAGLAVAATRSPGFRATSASLHNGSVWVTNLATSQLGRLNMELRRLDAGPILRAARFDVLQDGETVVVVDAGTRTMASVDTAYVRVTASDRQLPSGFEVGLAGGVGAVLDVGGGRLWTTPGAALGALDVAAQEPVLTDLAGATMTIGVDGRVHVLEPAAGRVTTLPPPTASTPTPEPVRHPFPALREGARYVVTAVGAEPLVLDVDGAVVLLPDGGAVELGDIGGAPALQLPGPAAAEVLVAGDEALAAVPLSGGAVRRLPPAGRGGAARPVRVGPCVYAAWSATPWRYGSCERDAAGAPVPDGAAVVDARPGSPLVFRVNRDAVALNAPEYGASWLLTSGSAPIDNWDEVRPSAEDDQPDLADLTQDDVEALEDCVEGSSDPVAVEDEFGARPTQATVLPVLANDSDENCDPVMIVAVGDLVGGAVDVIDGGQAVQVTPAPGADAVSFEYTVDDGTGGARASARVRVEVVPFSVNRAPVRLTGGRSVTVVEEGRSVVYDVLVDWIDPDGDPLVLRDARFDGVDTVRASPDGAVTFIDAGAVQGAKRVSVVVSDGREASAGELVVDVQPRRDLPPRARNDFAATTVGRSVTVWPLLNDTDPNGDELSLAEVTSATPGATVAFDAATASVTVSADAPGAVVVRYRSAANGVDAAASIRVQVRALGVNQPPVPVRDVAVVAVGSSLSRDVLVNDGDADDDVLLVTGLDVPDDVRGLTASVVDHAVVRIALTEPLAGPAVLAYRVSDGAEERQGTIVVLARDGLARNQPPQPQPDRVRVRAGDVVDIPVLANDADPDGDRVRLVPDDLVPPAGGVLFADGDRLRFRAPPDEGSYVATYAVTDGRDENAARVAITVTADDEKNQPPTAGAVRARVLSGGTVRIRVAAASQDPDGDTATVSAPGGRAPARGAVLAVEGDTIVYRAEENVFGTDEFTYAVDDGRGGVAEGLVRVGVARRSGNQRPVAVNDTLTVLPGRRLRVDVLANDVDPDGDELTFADRALQPGPGVDAQLGTDGRVELTSPAVPGTVSVGYTIDDGRGGRSAAFLSVTSSDAPPPLPPVARDDVVRDVPPPTESEAVVPVLANDDDPNGDVAALLVSLPPGQGDAASTDGRELRVRIGERAVKVVYTVTDTEGLRASAVVLVPGRANQPPVRRESPPDVVTDAGRPVRLSIDDFVVDPEGQPLRLTTAAGVTAAAGTVALVDERTVEFGPGGFVGRTSVSFEVADRDLNDPGVRTLRVTVPVLVRPGENVPPVAQDGLLDVERGGSATLDLRPLASDANPGDESALTFSGPTGADGLQAAIEGAVLRVTAPASLARGTLRSVVFTVSDGRATATGTVTVRVTGVDDPLPRANPDEVPNAEQGRQDTIDPLANDAPSPAALRIVELAFEPSHITATTDGRIVTYRPAADFVGTAVIRYTVEDVPGDPERRVSGQITVNVRGRPGSPSAPTVEDVLDHTVVLSWQPPGQNGAAIIDYVVTSGSYTRTCPTTTCVLDDLTNDVTYQFRVAARNAVGLGDPSPPSAPVRPDAKPGRVATPTIAFGDGQLSVAWAAPATSGSPVRLYDIEISPGGTIATVPSTTYTWAGLTNGQPYRFRVRARNDAPSPGEWSDFSSPDSPAGRPGRPLAPTANTLAGGVLGGQAAVSWVAPAENGAPISYTLVVIEDGAEVGRLPVSGTTRTVATRNGSTYSFVVIASNKAGDSAPSDPSPAARSYGAPSVITDLAATPGNGQVTLSFTDPSDGGNPISAYRVVMDDGAAATVLDLPPGRVITGLNPNQTYSFRVYAHNGYDAPSTGVVTALVYGLPRAPTISAVPSESPLGVTYSWAPPAPNGLPIVELRYTVDGLTVETIAPVAGSFFVPYGYGEQHSFVMEAVDAAGQKNLAATIVRTAAPTPTTDSLVVTVGPACPWQTVLQPPFRVCTMRWRYSVAATDWAATITGIEWWSDTAENPLGIANYGCSTAPCRLDGGLTPAYRGLSPNGGWTDEQDLTWIDQVAGGRPCVWVVLRFADGRSTTSTPACATWP